VDDATCLVAPVIADPTYGYQAVNVESQERAEESLLATVRWLIAVRRQHSAFSRGRIEFLDSGNDGVLAFLRRHLEETLLVVANLAASPQQAAVHLPSSASGGTAIDIVDEVFLPTVGPGPYTLTLGPHAYCWLQLVERSSMVANEDAGQRDES
jgi:maltose alpha-D-glucosyltransferase/alpha-amylase